MPAADFDAIFAALREILARHEKNFAVKTDSAETYYLDEKGAVGPNGKPVFFGAVMRKKSHVGFYLGAIAEEPALAEGISAALARRKGGKSCFQFKRAEPELFAELAELTARLARR